MFNFVNDVVLPFNWTGSIFVILAVGDWYETCLRFAELFNSTNGKSLKDRTLRFNGLSILEGFLLFLVSITSAYMLIENVREWKCDLYTCYITS